jgi:hypothetical protein
MRGAHSQVRLLTKAALSALLLPLCLSAGDLSLGFRFGLNPTDATWGFDSHDYVYSEKSTVSGWKGRTWDGRLRLVVHDQYVAELGATFAHDIEIDYLRSYAGSALWWVEYPADDRADLYLFSLCVSRVEHLTRCLRAHIGAELALSVYSIDVIREKWWWPEEEFIGTEEGTVTRLGVIPGTVLGLELLPIPTLGFDLVFRLGYYGYGDETLGIEHGVLRFNFGLGGTIYL